SLPATGLIAGSGGRLARLDVEDAIGRANHVVIGRVAVEFDGGPFQVCLGIGHAAFATVREDAFPERPDGATGRLDGRAGQGDDSSHGGVSSSPCLSPPGWVQASRAAFSSSLVPFTRDIYIIAMSL